MEHPLVSIITVNYNQTGVTRALLDSIRKQRWPMIEIIVVDNGSDENPFPQLADDYPEIKYIRCPQNLGFAVANNLAIIEAQGDFLFLLNNDTEITPNCIGELVKFCQDNVFVGAVSPLICYFPEPGSTGPDRIQFAGMTRVSNVTGRNQTIGAGELDHGQFSQPARTDYVHGAALFFPRVVIGLVGILPEEFFLYYEELDWCEQMRGMNMRLWVLPTVRIYHKESFTTSRMGALKTYFSFRNRMLFMRRNRSEHLWKFHLYLFAVVLPKTLFGYAKAKDWDNARAVWAALRWYFFKKSNPFEKMVVGRQPGSIRNDR